MPVKRLYCSDLQVGLNRLSAEESHHATNALRLQPGHEVRLFDGAGNIADGILDRVSKRETVISVQQIDQMAYDLPCRLTLAVSMPRTHRQGYLIEKCTELGVAGIWAIQTDRGVAQPGQGAADKWTRRTIEAAKQCGRNWLPQIKTAQTFALVIAQANDFDLALFLDKSDEAKSFAQYLSTDKPLSVLAIIGPEGGWSDEERTQARDAGLASTTLAPTILRTETAAMAACSLVASLGI